MTPADVNMAMLAGPYLFVVVHADAGAVVADPAARLPVAGTVTPVAGTFADLSLIHI